MAIYIEPSLDLTMGDALCIDYFFLSYSNQRMSCLGLKPLSMQSAMS